MRLLLLTLFFSALCTFSLSKPDSDFLQCLRYRSGNSTAISKVVYTPGNPSYQFILDEFIQNLRLISSQPHPVAIVAPTDESQVQSTLFCSRKFNFQLRIRSGGHDFEGLSYYCNSPFVLLDLFNLKSIHVDVKTSTAWVQSGATLGELYYTISGKSKTLSFPGGYWSSVGVGGLISGGGYGALVRKYGLASDNVLDVRFLDVNGRILTKNTMSKDLYWAIRGGGGGNFGIVLAWKLHLVRVPKVVTYCHLERSLEQNATSLIHRWQYVAPKMPKEMLLEVRFRSAEISTPETNTTKRTIIASFDPIYLGPLETGLLPLLNAQFPELGMSRQNCTETDWIGAAVHLARFPNGTQPEIFLNRSAVGKACAKQKSDYVQNPIPMKGLIGLWKILNEIDAGEADIVWTPYLGRMSEISETETPYPHRKNLFMALEAAHWDSSKDGYRSTRHLVWMEKLHKYLGKYVSKSPRCAYVNYRDLDLGRNNGTGVTGYEEARKWGVKYFKGNFKRLALVKGKVDPGNYFRNEQSIPPLFET